MTDEEILEDWDFYEDLLEKKGNIQCVHCGGWALICPCESNWFSKEVKKDTRRYLELMEENEKTMGSKGN